MSQLEEMYPELHSHFLRVGFTVQIGLSNPFGKTEVDLALEKIVNRGTQTPRGDQRFQPTNKCTVVPHYIMAEHKAEAIRQLRNLVSTCSQQRLSHTDLQTSRIKKEENGEMSIVDMLENNLTNPFSGQP